MDRGPLIEHVQFFFRVAEALHSDLSNEEIAERAINSYEGFNDDPTWSECVHAIREYIDLREQAVKVDSTMVWNEDIASGMHNAVNVLFDLRQGDTRAKDHMQKVINNAGIVKLA